MTTAPLGSYRNLSHPTISTRWARKKADGESSARDFFTKLLGINWFPVDSADQSDPDARVEKQLVCGRLHEAALFIGLHPTREYDWNFHIVPDNPVYTDTLLLEKNARRVYQSRRLNFESIAQDSQAGRWFEPSRFFHWDDSRPRRAIIEAEVSAPRELLTGPKQPFPCVGRDCDLTPRTRVEELTPQSLEAPARICAYGPWVQEALHGSRPEIHPAEGLVWRANDGSVHVLMLQDASGRFDWRNNGDWITIKGGLVSTAEHWVQPAMLAEFTIPVALGRASDLRVELVGQKGLEPIGAREFLPNPPAPIRGDSVQGDAALRSLVQMGVLPAADGQPATFVLRAQIRGEDPSDSFRNLGAYAHFRITGIPVR